MPDSRPAAASHVTVSCCPCHALSLCIEATSLDLKEMTCRACGTTGHLEATWRPPTPSRETEGQSRECPGQGRAAQSTVVLWRSPVAGQSVCVVCGDPAPASRCTGPGAFLLAARPRLMTGRLRESLRDPGEHLRGQLTARGTDSGRRRTAAPTESLRQVVSNSIYNSNSHFSLENNLHILVKMQILKLPINDLIFDSKLFW